MLKLLTLFLAVSACMSSAGLGAETESLSCDAYPKATGTDSNAFAARLRGVVDRPILLTDQLARRTHQLDGTCRIQTFYQLVNATLRRAGLLKPGEEIPLDDLYLTVLSGLAKDPDFKWRLKFNLFDIPDSQWTRTLLEGGVVSEAFRQFQGGLGELKGAGLRVVAQAPGIEESQVEKRMVDLFQRLRGTPGITYDQAATEVNRFIREELEKQAKAPRSRLISSDKLSQLVLYEIGGDHLSDPSKVVSTLQGSFPPTASGQKYDGEALWSHYALELRRPPRPGGPMEDLREARKARVQALVDASLESGVPVAITYAPGLIEKTENAQGMVTNRTPFPPETKSVLDPVHVSAFVGRTRTPEGERAYRSADSIFDQTELRRGGDAPYRLLTEGQLYGADHLSWIALPGEDEEKLKELMGSAPATRSAGPGAQH